MTGINWEGWSVEHEKVFRSLLWEKRGNNYSEKQVSEKNENARGSFAFITTNDNNFAGGSEVWWRETAMRLHSMGFKITILLKKWLPTPPFIKAIEVLGVQVEV